MKITFDQLTRHLVKGLMPIYFISGDETLLLNEAAELIKGVALKQGFNHERFTAEHGFLWQNFLSATKNLSLFAEKKLIELHLPSVKLDATGSRLLQNYCLSPSADKILIITAPKLESGWQKIKWVQSIIEQNIFLQIWPIETKDLPNWIKQRLHKNELNADMETCKLLAERLEGNLLALAQEIEKLKLLYGSGTITFEQVLSGVANNIKANLFTLVDSALEGDTKKTIYMLESLKAEGIAPILLLWVLVRELRLLIAILEAKKTNPLEKILQEKHVMTRHIPLVKKVLSRHSLANLKGLLKYGAKIDRIIKGIMPGDIWQELMQLTMRLASDFSLKAAEDVSLA
jgi:DNA polymerase III subunit delta